MSVISEWFWTESVWLPANVSWSDVANGPRKSVVYADTRDFLHVFPLGVMIFVSRYVLDRYCFIPLGKLLNIKEKTTRKVLQNDKLEALYLASPKQTDFSNLANKLNMTDRQVERWWRLRCNVDKPSTLDKFCESMWKVVFYMFVSVYGFYVLWDKEWLWDREKCYDGYPHQGITDDVKWYYMLQTAAYWYLLIFQFKAVKRKDSLQMYIHHIVAICLLSASWISNLYRIGTLVPLLHDCGDVALEAGKALKYARYQKACNYIFVVFIIIWIVTRIIGFPIYVIALSSDYIKNVPIYLVLKGLLWMLFSLHIVWTWYIIQIAYRAAKSGGVQGDVRSSDSEENEISNHTD